ncbi:hypothetical protein [Flavivirga jejuensis]|uniref:Uncharacterized protein n=1 Tax=Flavivirga jejuensis TaxID=870487 RepID=A0ABT8WLL2_9FLAO|nr:hypothetical protein [Flavivirga jejuensis]MDO5973841.1 hypothetical protein [Flavivirga jejuensis]
MNIKENTNTSEEIDLGQLFKLIGNTINVFFKRIAIILKTIFHLFILFLLFFRDHFFKFLLALFLGIGVGAYMDYIAVPLYKSTMVIHPNFNSVKQMYSYIEFYNQLAKQQESKELAEVLNIPLEIAKSVKHIEIAAFSDEIQKMKQFSKFIENLDSITLKEIDYQDYLKKFNDINAEFHEIQIEATKPEAAKQCEKVIVTAVQNNEYFKLQKKIYDDNIIVKDTMIRDLQREIKNLQSFYKEIKILEAQKLEGGTTNINLTDNKIEQISEIELFDQIKKLKDEKVELNIDKGKTINIINVISEFPNKGILINDFSSKKIVQMPLFFISVLFLIIVMGVLNKYLANYSN